MKPEFKPDAPREDRRIGACFVSYDQSAGQLISYVDTRGDLSMITESLAVTLCDEVECAFVVGASWMAKKAAEIVNGKDELQAIQKLILQLAQRPRPSQTENLLRKLVAKYPGVTPWCVLTRRAAAEQ